MISQEELMTILDYNAQTGVFTWKKPPKEHARLSGKEAGTRSTKYILIRINNNKYKAHRLAWLAIYGEFPSDEIDHIAEVSGAGTASAGLPGYAAGGNGERK
ncbi:MAG: hypothetical protein H5T98_00885 [Syntrophomonadaceae bacterium]|nr:hypothetical protein [Syntrophomonadaceae bacterium]